MIALAATYGAQLALGTSLLLLLGLACARASSSPGRRHGWAESLLWSLPVCAWLLVVPLRRPLGLELWGARIGTSPVSVPAEFRVGDIGGPVSETVSTSLAEMPGVPLLSVVFLVGAALVLVYLLCGVLLLRGMLRGARELPAESRASCGRVLVARGARGARRPFCVGTGTWGLVVLPPYLVMPGREDQLEAVLAHERAHLRSGHGRARLVAAALLPLFYWNPLFWVLVSRMRADAELCADDAAAAAVGKTRYVRALVRLLEEKPCHQHTALPLMGALAPTRPFLERMETLMARSAPLEPSRSPARRAVTVALALAAVALVNVSCGTTSSKARPTAMARIAVPFETLSLEGTDLGEALVAGSETDAPFPERVEALDGRPIAIEGYLIPLQWEKDKVSEFMLLRDNLQCCMGGAPTWGHWLIAPAYGSVTTEFQPGIRVRVEGSLELTHPTELEPSEYAQSIYELRDWGVSPIE